MTSHPAEPWRESGAQVARKWRDWREGGAIRAQMAQNVSRNTAAESASEFDSLWILTQAGTGVRLIFVGAFFVQPPLLLP